MDAFQLLKKDHQTVRQLFEKLTATEASKTQSRNQIFEQIKREFEIHATIEEEIFYPALANESETADLIKEAYSEHKEAKQLLQKLSKMEKSSEDWIKLCGALQDNIEHHVEEEEDDLFERAKEVLAENTIRDLGKQMERRKHELEGGAAEERPRRHAR